MNIKNSNKGFYYSGGLSELVSNPSPLTYSFLQNWFTGSGSIGKAMILLGLPFQKNDLPVLEIVDKELVVNLKNEEETLYKRTIFKYNMQEKAYETPNLIIDIKKLLNPVCLFNTLKILLVESKWISNPQATIDMVKKMISEIPDKFNNENIEKIDDILKNNTWPTVIAIGLISEFYNQLLLKAAGEEIVSINKYISSRIAKRDWFFCSIADQEKVKLNEMTFTEYLTEYGLRADKDYELTSPRWHEIPENIKERVKNYVSKNIRGVEEPTLNNNKKLQKIVNASIELQLLRSETKEKVLLIIDMLRHKILEETKYTSEISNLSRQQLLKGAPPVNLKQKIDDKSKQKTLVHKILSSGKGTNISQGIAIGVVKNVINNYVDLPKGTIGIFPNSSPEFAIQYPKCSGMIFMKGGQTSHGAIVAREFGIPAITDPNIEGIEDGIELELNGTTGEWHIR